MILLGHNGAGKTTLIFYMLGYYNNIAQHPYLANFCEIVKPLDKNSTGYAPEAALLDTELSARDYFFMMAALKGAKSYDIEELLKKVALDVDPKMPIKNYSKGMKQRLLLAIALLGNPKTLILDEPTSGLDPYGRKEIEGLLISLKSDHNFIISTHSLELAMAMEDEIWILKEGKRVYVGRPSSLEELIEEFSKHRPKRLQ